MDLGLADKVAFVAGSSRGIGLAVAERFAGEGARVVITGRDKASLETARARIAAPGRGHVLAIGGDMTDAADIRRAFDETLAYFGRVDAVVANVGSGIARTGWALGAEDWDSSLTVNLVGGMLLASTALPHLMAGEASSLTFVSSIAGLEALDAPLPYSAAKAALASAVKGLARQVAARGVRVNAVAPGNILFPGGRWEQKLEERREFFERYIETEVPMRRFGTPEEVADSVLFLASPRAAFITGACLVVDGGQMRAFP